MKELDLQHANIHGHDIAYRMAGDGPVLLLIHGMACSSSTWLPVMPTLARDFKVVAPDLPGHGASDKPRGDYSLGAFASGLRDLLVSLRLERATLVGQSLGGGVAMQFAYQFPERSERLVLVSSGGLGEEVNVGLRLLTLPGVDYVLPLACTTWLHDTVVNVSRVFKYVGLQPTTSAVESWNAYGSLADPATRTAFLHTLRAVVDASGQRVSARDKLYLASMMPTLIMWGDRDRVIPVAQAHQTHDEIPGSRLEIFEGAGHFPHAQCPQAFADALTDFMCTTSPAHVSDEHWKALLAQSGER